MNRHLNVVFLLLLVFTRLALAGPEKVKHVLTGTLVDINCATDTKKDLAKLRSEHTRKCLLMPICAESGYAILTDNDEVLRFDAKGNEQASKLIEKQTRNQKWRVSVDGVVVGAQLRVLHIKLLGPK
jgi:hypothetical protein